MRVGESRKMKAKEVLRRYAAGERNFCNANLRGANFKGKDLSGADFSGADIRSASFTDAILRRTSFENAKGGLQRRWFLVQWLLVALLAAVTGLFQGSVGAFFITMLLEKESFVSPLEWATVLGAYLIVVAVTFGAVTIQGFSPRAYGSVLTDRKSVE